MLSLASLLTCGGGYCYHMSEQRMSLLQEKFTSFLAVVAYGLLAATTCALSGSSARQLVAAPYGPISSGLRLTGVHGPGRHLLRCGGPWPAEQAGASGHERRSCACRRAPLRGHGNGNGRGRIPASGLVAGGAACSRPPRTRTPVQLATAGEWRPSRC